jgi:hypothetical protein
MPITCILDVSPLLFGSVVEFVDVFSFIKSVDSNHSPDVDSIWNFVRDKIPCPVP